MRSTILVNPLFDEHSSAQARWLAGDLGRMVGLDLQDQALFAAAVAEVAHNAVQYGRDGEIEFAIDDAQTAGCIVVIVRDGGPGIPASTVADAQQGERGLALAQRLSDTLTVERSAAAGTVVTLCKYLPAFVRPTAETIARWREAALDDVRRSPAEVQRQQNRELISIIEAWRSDETELCSRVALINRLHDELVASQQALRIRSEELSRARQAGEDAARAKAVFLATMGHEIRTPLNAIIGMNGLLVDTELDTRQRELVETARISGEYLLGLIDDILDFSGFTAGRLELQRQAFDLRSCVEDCLDLVAATANTKSLEFAYQLDGRLPTYFYGDVGRFRQLLVNLLANAVNFTTAGEVIAEINGDWLRRQPGTSCHEIEIAINDTGIGIGDEQRNQLFEPFNQTETSIAHPSTSSGMGLAICKRIVEAMNGRIWHENRPEGGSSFRFRIELEKAPPLEALPRTSHAPPGALLGMHALIVDDNQTNRRILALQCDSFGMTHVDTGSPLEALQWIREGRPFDIAILDHLMPELDGLALAAEIRKLRNRQALKIVMLTSAGPMQNSVHEAQLDLQGIFRKPLHLSCFYDALVSSLSTPPGRYAQRNDEISQLHDRAEQPPKILLVEDNRVNQRVALLMLEKLRLKADTAANGVEALQVLSKLAYDIVLMDIQMPEMDGLEATRRIRRQLPREQQPRIIAMTANALSEDRERCLAAGMDDYIGKPVRIEELRRALLGDPARRRNAREPATAGADSAGVPGFLRQAVQQLADSTSHSGARQILQTLSNDAPVQINGLREALLRGDAVETRRFAHSMKSNSLMIGATVVADLLLAIERLASENRLDQLLPLVPTAVAEYEAVLAAVSALSREMAEA